MPIAIPIAIAAASLISGLFGSAAAAADARRQRQQETMNRGYEMESQANTQGAAAQQDALGSIVGQMRLR